MEVEDIFSSRTEFRDKIVTKLQTDLLQFGLMVNNLSIEEMVDQPGSEYFSSLRQKIVETAANTAKIEVAEARRKGNVGEKDKFFRYVSIELKVYIFFCEFFSAQQSISKAETDSKLVINTNMERVAVSLRSLAVVNAENKRAEEMAQTEANMAVKQKQAELNSFWEIARAKQEEEKLRADELSKIRIAAEGKNENNNKKNTFLIWSFERSHC